MQNEQINWIYLKDRLCPKCMGKLYVKGLLDSTYYCINKNCGFKISSNKFTEIVDKMINGPKKGKKAHDNQEELNNLGIEGKVLPSWGVEPEE